MCESRISNRLFAPGSHGIQRVEAAPGIVERTEVFGYPAEAMHRCKIRVKGGKCGMHRGYKRGINRRIPPPFGTGQVSTLRRHDDVAVSQHFLQYADNSLFPSGDESKSTHPGMYDAGIGRLQANRQKGFMQLAAGSYGSNSLLFPRHASPPFARYS